ncbi:hypothetical protein EJB05_18444 [Eragrostis curvula]|uniref:Bowman-Birk serine protease inhibitors family domain-containing protein n=1 Tax=Eragrostis curvula TaxID=38414 RepID=A0A5J9VL62_9POAL|nr:hypothetical protein EJB05_18444 [Eragrostis curvula]
MKPQTLLITLAIVASLAILPLVESQGRPKAAPWPCCNNCGSICSFSFPPLCFCSDVSPRGCHSACRNCEKFTSSNGATLFQCMDLIANFCQRRCTPAA